MSAHFDRSQRFVFRYRAQGGVLPKSEILSGAVKIEEYRPAHFIGKSIHGEDRKFTPTPKFMRDTPPPVEGLKRNLSELNDLHQRLRFMLGELESIMKKKS